MRLKRRLSALGLAVILTLQVSCGVTETTSTDSDPDFGYAPRYVSDLLTCDPLPYVAITKQVGARGGRIKVGSHVLVIPAGALDQDVAITAEQVSDSVNSVRFGPEGLTFSVPAELTMSYSNCTGVDASKRIAYTTEALEVIEVLPSHDRPQSRTVISPVDHFSRYAVAY